MSYDLENNFSASLSSLINPLTGRADAQGSVVSDLLAQSGIKLQQAAQYGSDGYTGGQGFERVRFNRESVLSEEAQASNAAILAPLGNAQFTGANLLNRETGKPAYLNQIIAGDGKILGTLQEDYKKESTSGKLLKAYVGTFLGAAFAGAAGFGALAGAGGSAASTTVGSVAGTVGKAAATGAIQGAVNTAISGGDIGKGIISGAVSGGLGSTLSPVLGYLRI